MNLNMPLLKVKFPTSCTASKAMQQPHAVWSMSMRIIFVGTVDYNKWNQAAKMFLECLKSNDLKINLHTTHRYICYHKGWREYSWITKGLNSSCFPHFQPMASSVLSPNSFHWPSIICLIDIKSSRCHLLIKFKLQQQSSAAIRIS